MKSALLALVLTGCGVTPPESPINPQREDCWRKAQDAFLQRTEACTTDACVLAEEPQLKTEQELCP